jgi:hypothetical protein
MKSEAICTLYSSCTMTPSQRIVGRLAFVACFSCPMAYTQSVQFLPELDAHLTLNSRARVYLQAEDDREGGDPEQFTFGPSVQLYVKPLIRLKRITVFDLDDSKSKHLVLESGYRVITAPSAETDHRAIEAATSHFPLMAGILLSDRNRADLDWKGGGFRWRYRNKLTLERTFSVHWFHFTPYIAAEPFYNSQYGKWSSTDLYGGCLFPVGKRVEFDSYYEHENDTGKSPNRQQTFVGVALHLYFFLKTSSDIQPMSPKKTGTAPRAGNN